LRNVKVIYDCHEFHPHSSTESLPSYIGKPLLKLIEYIENFMASKADAVITVNDRLGKRFKKLNSRVIILPNYPPLDIFDHAKRPNGTPTDNCVRFIYVGGLAVNRGLFKMIDILNVIKSSAKCRLTLIGNFATDETRQSFWRYVHELKVGNMIDYKGYLPYNEIIQHLMKSDFGLCMIFGRERYQWTEPIKYFEYSGAGLPVIVSDLEAMKKLIRDNKNGIALKPYLNNSDEVRKMGERGRIAFVEKYNWEALEPRLFELYSSLT
jgi:glycosyltransferase involved in cell wall biosynthesis